MEPNPIPHRPTVADEVKVGVDNAQVIEATLPPAPVRRRSARLKDEASRAADSARDYVIDSPFQSMLIAAAGGAALTAGLIAFMRGERRTTRIAPR